ncbi:MAG: hypothetical protein LBG64_01260 [Pseudomonadales bacterium]|jgi:hypothetical protein|nr:hypothetical protein [Pseudomonadales bacterium]
MFKATDADGVTKEYSNLKQCVNENLPAFIENAAARQLIDVEQLFEHLSPVERRLALQHLYAIGLTNACNGRCTFCGNDAKSGITKQLAFEPLVALIGEYLSDDEISCCRKSCLVLHTDTDPADYAVVENGRIKYNIFHVEDARRFQCEHYPVSQDITHLPLHSIEMVMHHMVDAIVKMRTGTTVDKNKILISVTDSNRELVGVFIDEMLAELMSKLKIDVKGPAAREEYRQKMLAYNIPTLFPDKTEAGDFHNIPTYVVQRKWMSHVGRNFPGDGLPIESLLVHWRTGEGTIITPHGVKTVLNILPTSQNPSGCLSFPVLSGNFIFRRSETLTFEEALNKGRKTPLILPTLRDSLIGDGDTSLALTPENEILREAYCLRMLANTLSLHGPEALHEALKKIKGHDDFNLRLELAEKISTDCGGDDKVSVFVKKAIGEVRTMFELEGWQNKKELRAFFVSTQSGYPAEVAKTLIDLRASSNVSLT